MKMKILELYNILGLLGLYKSMLFVLNFMCIILFFIIIVSFGFKTCVMKSEMNIIHFVYTCTIIYCIKSLCYVSIMKQIAVFGDEKVVLNLFDVIVENYFFTVFFFLIILDFFKSMFIKFISGLSLFVGKRLNVERYILNIFCFFVIFSIFVFIFFYVLDILTVFRILQKLII